MCIMLCSYVNPINTIKSLFGECIGFNKTKDKAYRIVKKVNKMVSNKSPISLLQEMIVQQRMPLPFYEEAPSDNVMFPFKCTVKVGSNVGIGYARTKKEAKHNCAEDILKKLGFDSVTAAIISNNNNSPAKMRSKSEQINHIGLLNEHAAHKRVLYPVYLNMLPEDGQYTVECTFVKLKCLGYGTNKKLAKQDSAKKMLERVKTEDIDYTDSFQKTVDLENILKKYESISVNDDNDKSVKSVLDVKLPKIEIKNVSMHELKSKLNAQGYTFTLEVFQRDPYIMALKIDHTSYVVMGVGKTKEEATDNLLQTASVMFQDGINFGSRFMETKND